MVFDGDPAGHFTDGANTLVPIFKTVSVQAGTEARSFLETLRLALSAADDDDIVYLCEDDYWHRAGWPAVLREGLREYDYVTLYDHPDKYPGAPTPVDYLWRRHPVVRATPSCHWRATVSTTNTYACVARTLRQDADIHASFSATRRTTADHEKFMGLWSSGRSLGSSVPAWATHAEVGCLAPVIQWAREKNI